MARAPTETRATKKDGGVTVAWTSPGESVDGKRLSDLSAFIVERRQGAEPFTPIAEIPADTMHRLRPVRHYTYVDEAPVEGAEYRVIAYTADGQRGLAGAAAKITVPAKPKNTPDTDTPARSNPRRGP
jgi:hypothetical protein